MDNDKLKKLEERIEKLENPTNFSNKFIEALAREGFLRFEKELIFTAGVSGMEFRVVFVNFGKKTYVISVDSAYTYVPFTADSTTDTMTSRNHGFADNQQVIVMSTGSLPSPLLPQSYWIINATTDTFQLSTDGINPDNITDNGVGTHYAVFFT